MSMTTLISKLLSFFVTSDKSQVHQVDILLSLGELAPSSSSASSLSMPSSLSSLDVGGDGEEATVKPPMTACRRVIRPHKASIHVHKLCHDGLKCHSTCRRRRSGGGWSGGNRRSHRLYLRLPQFELCLALSNGSCIYGTHHWKIRRLEKRDRKVVKKPRDSWRKNEFITGRRIPKYIYEG